MTKPKRPASISVPGIRKALLNAREKSDTHQLFIFFKKFHEWWAMDEVLEVGDHTATFRNKCFMNGEEFIAEDTVPFSEIAMIRLGYKIEVDDNSVAALEDSLDLNINKDQINDCHDT